MQTYGHCNECNQLSPDMCGVCQRCPKCGCVCVPRDQFGRREEVGREDLNIDGLWLMIGGEG